MITSLEFKKLDKDARAPFRAHVTDAGFDLYCTSFDDDGDVITYHTGIAVNIPDGHCGLLLARSSVYKKDLVLANGVGLIDQDYHGELIFKYRKTQPFSKSFAVGDRIGQIMIMPFLLAKLVEVDEFSRGSERGDGGFGSSGEK